MINKNFQYIFCFLILFLALNNIVNNVSAQEINQNITQNISNNSTQLLPQALPNIYAIEGIEAKATDKSPTSARTLAFENAKKDAFLVLLSRLNLPPETVNYINLDDLSSMVRSERVLN